MRGVFAAVLALLPSFWNAVWAQDDPVISGSIPAAESMSEGYVALLVIVPTIVILASAFLKAAVVLNILRGAFGQVNVPPAVVVTALAFLLSIVVMLPVIDATFEASRDEVAPQSLGGALGALDRTSGPFLEFLERNSSAESQERFAELAARGDTPLQSELSTSSSLKRLRVLLPAFVTTELTEAFMIGFLLLLPFIVIDLLVAALLQGAGLASVQPHSIALPLKLLVFVLVGGWQLLLEGLITGYAA